MASTAVLAGRMQRAHDRAARVIGEHGPEESRERLAGLGTPNTRAPVQLAAYQAELIASLAEMVERLGSEKEAAAKKSKKS